MICPKCSYNRETTNDSFSNLECPNCGVIYAKCVAAKVKKNKLKERKSPLNRKPPRSKQDIFLKVVIVFSSIIISGYVINSFFPAPVQDITNTAKTVDIAVDMTAFGITLGESLPQDIEQCGLDNNKYPCFKGRNHPSIENGLVNLRLSPEIPFLFLKDDSIFCQIDGGTVGGIKFILSGRDTERYALEALIDKYGKPTSYRDVVLENGFGARFSSFESSWSLNNLKIFFFPADSKTRWVYMLTSSGAKKDLARSKQILENTKGKI